MVLVKSYRNPNIEVELTWGAVVSAGLGVKTAQKPSVAILMLIPQLSHNYPTQVSALGIMMEMAHICISSAAPLAAGGIVPYITTLVMVMMTMMMMMMILVMVVVVMKVGRF